MDKKKKIILIIILLILALLLKFYPSLDTKLQGFLIESETAYIDRIIDGDTVKSNEISIRLLGINSPEKGEKYYSEAKEFLEELILNETVRLEFRKDREDKYGRTLAYLYFKEDNINKKIVEEGYANFYFPSGRDIYYKDFEKAWEKCIEQNKNLCEVSQDKCATCIELREFDYKDEIITLYNKCGFDCELTKWKIKDEGRKKFIFPEFVLKDYEEVTILIGEEENTENILYWKGEDYVWTESGDTLFLRDENGKLVLWRGY